jgi:hypothetical protein
MRAGGVPEGCSLIRGQLREWIETLVPFTLPLDRACLSNNRRML